MPHVTGARNRAGTTDRCQIQTPDRDDRRRHRFHDRVAEEGPGVRQIVEAVASLVGEPQRDVVVDLAHRALERMDEEPAPPTTTARMTAQHATMTTAVAVRLRPDEAEPSGRFARHRRTRRPVCSMQAIRQSCGGPQGSIPFGILYVHRGFRRSALGALGRRQDLQSETVGADIEWPREVPGAPKNALVEVGAG